MVATRNHPRDFPPPPTTDSPSKSSPTKRTTRNSTAASASPSPPASPFPPRASSLLAPPAKLQPRASKPRSSAWSHTPSNLALVWLAVSLPLVIWDTGYVLLRPYTLPGGSLHWPLWAPYELYGRVDMVYSAQAYHAGVGFTAAQGSVNAIETALYLGYLWIVYAYGRAESRQGTGAPDKRNVGWLGEARTVYGKEAVLAVLIGYTTFVLTLSKTVLYWLNEAFSGFTGIGQNDLYSLVVLWIIPNGAWIVFPTYLGYVFGKEIIQGLEVAAGGGMKEN